jgi:predicted nucleotidyltransferase
MKQLDLVLALLKYKKFHVRKASEILDLPVSSVLRIVDGLISENVLDFNFEGRNKVFWLKRTLKARNYIFMAENYKLVKLLKKHPKLSHVFSSVLSKVKGEMVVLFGSYAKGLEKSTSDLDIYVNTSRNEIKESIELVYSKINVKIGRFDLNNYLVAEIVEDHVILQGFEEFYERTGFFKDTISKEKYPIS